MNELPNHLVEEIVGKLGRRNAARAAGTSTQMRRAVKRRFPNLPRGARPFPKSKYLKKLSRALRRLDDVVESVWTAYFETGAMSMRTLRALIRDMTHIEVAVIFVKKETKQGSPMYGVARLKRMSIGRAIYRQTLKTLGKTTRSMSSGEKQTRKDAVKALKRTQTHRDETHARPVMDAFLTVVDQLIATHVSKIPRRLR